MKPLRHNMAFFPFPFCLFPLHDITAVAYIVCCVRGLLRSPAGPVVASPVLTVFVSPPTSTAAPRLFVTVCDCVVSGRVASRRGTSRANAYACLPAQTNAPLLLCIVRLPSTTARSLTFPSRCHHDSPSNNHPNAAVSAIIRRK
jgi:hypothetical protein